jgi:hypothetical protein
MTIPFNSNPGGLFNRMGALGALLADFQAYSNTNIVDDFNAILAQYGTAPSIVSGVPDQQSSAQSGLMGNASLLQSIAQNTINLMVFLDNPQSSNTSLTVSIVEVIRQMALNGQTVKQCNVTISSAPVPAVSNTGNGLVVGTVKRGDGRVNENSFAEVGYFFCTADAQTGGAQPGNENWQWQGEVAETNTLANDWPLGSGQAASLTSISAIYSNGSGGNLLTNSGFETYATTPNVPDNWILVTGTAGTQIAQNTVTGNVYTGTSSLEFIGDGLTSTSIKQTFGQQTTGTGQTLSPDTPYAFAIWLKLNVVPAAGVLTIDLVDQNNTVILDDQGVSNAMVIPLTAASTTFTGYGGVFRLPKLLPNAYGLRVHLSTPLSSGSTLYLDNGALGLMTQLYSAGPSLAIFSGSENWLLGDEFSVTVTNDRGGASNLATFQTLFDRLLDMRDSNLLLPSSPTPSIPDALI